MNRFLRLLMCSCLLLLAACSSSPNKLNPRDQALKGYEVAIRWSEFEEALHFVDPLLRAEQLVTDLERERFKQIQVTGYDVKNTTLRADGLIEQVVEIRLISKNTQIERSIIDRQLWRFDPEGKRYWLTSGLPDFTPR